ncbi:amine oxidase [Terfezia claveryi]|nr:amine oxidase [Terfezia claveryi]
MAGLYTAMILSSMKYIKYEVLEASKRAGGRVYTHYFDPPNLNGNYYDVGAMRFPNIPIMARTFDLFRRLKIKEDLTPDPAQETLIRYYMGGPKTPLLYNNIRIIPSVQQPAGDTFHVSVANKGTVPNKFVAKGPREVTKPIYEYWRKRLSKSDTFEKGWKELMALDAKSVSVRTMIFKHLRDHPANYDCTDLDLYYVTNWCETMTGTTGSFDGSFVSAVIHSLEFDWPVFPDNLLDDPLDATVRRNVWRCVNGGADVITRRMLDTGIAGHINYNHKVTGIEYESEVMTVKTVNEKGEAHVPKKYTHVINTTTLGCLQTIDTRKAGLDYAHREAIRVLKYQHAVKLGIKFKRRWWAVDANQQIKKGGQGKTDRPTRVVVYPSYALNTQSDKSGVLLACYNSAQDAARLGSLFEHGNKLSKELVYSYVIADLAAMHDITEEKLRDLTEDYHVYNWYGDPLTRGSWSAFGPGQYSSFFGRIQRPQARGHLFFAGDSTSIYPGWIVGALDSAYRSVRQILLCETSLYEPESEVGKYLSKLIDFLEEHWGAQKYEPLPVLLEDSNGLEGWQLYLGIIGEEAGL